MIAAAAALELLREGNRRFVTGTPRLETPHLEARRADVAREQAPFAIVLGCSDSRVPAEIVFDQGLGELFVIRVAGNIVAPSQVGSVEFAVSRFGTRLVVVLGHSRCGAILATLEELRQPGGGASKNLRSIVDRVRRAVAPLVESGFGADEDELVRAAVRSNVRASVEHLRHGSELVERALREGSLAVVGAEYSLETGVVEFLDDVGSPA